MNMDASLSSHPEKNHRQFLFSGVPAKLEKSLVQKIESLHGKAVYPVRDTFTQSCTHVIVQEFSTTEKILGALAGGKWLLDTNYILDSYKQGHWLKEEGYELTVFNKVATYHRQQRMLKGYRVYEGWKILVLIEPSPYLRKFRRILAAGGAEIALKDDDPGIDFVVTNKEMLDHAKARVDSIIPLVDVSYIKCTLLFRHDPADLKKCDLRHPQEFKTSSKSADSSPLITLKKACSSHGGKNSSKRETGGSFPSKKRKTCSQLKQTSMSQFMKPSAKKPSSGDNIGDGRQSAPEKKPVSINKYASKSSHSDSTLSSASVVYDVEDDNQNQDELESSDIKKIQQTERKACEDVTLVNTLASTPMLYKVNCDIQNQDGLNSSDINEIQQTEKNTVEDITPVNALPVMEDVNEVKSNYISEVQQTDKNTSEDVTPVSPSSGVTSMDINTHSVELKEFHICLGKKITFAIDPKLHAKYQLPKCKISHSEQPEKVAELLRRPSLKDTATPPEPAEIKSVILNPLRFIRKWSLEHDSVSEQVQHHKEAVSPKSLVYTVTKIHIWKAIVQFLRTRNHLNEICSTSTLSIPRGSENFPNVKSEPLDAEFDTHQVLDTPNFQHVSYEHRELTTRELHFYTCCTDDDDTVNEEELLVNGIDTLLLQLSSYLYPPPNILGSLLKNFVVETQFSMVHSRALRVAYMLLSLHSPVSAKMRAYYLHALQHAMKPDDFGSYIPWKFVWSVIQVASCVESDEESWSSQNMEEEEILDKATRALHLLEFIVLLLTEDVRHSTYGEAVHGLLTWQIFCGSSKNCSVLTPPVEQLLHLWMSQQTTTPALNWHLSQLVAVVLEVLWKFSGQPLLPVDMLPASLAAVQQAIRISLKGLSSQKCLEVIWSLPTPWAQAVVTFIIVRELAQCPSRISLPYIMHHFQCSSRRRSNEVPEAEPKKEVFSSLSPVLKDHSPRISRKNSIPNINKRNSKGETLILRACIKNDVEEVRRLLSEPGVDINLSDYCGWTPLHEAALRGHEECIKLLLSHNPPHNVSSLSSHVKQGSNWHVINIQAMNNEEKRTPLHDAVIGNNYESVKLLLSHGGGELLKDKTMDGRTVFDMTSNQEILSLLRQYKNKGVDVKSTDSGLETKREDHKELFLTLASCYLEVSSYRYVALMIKKCIGEVLKNNIKVKKEDTVVKVKKEKTVGVFSSNDRESYCHSRNGQKNRTAKKHMPQYLNLVEGECLQDLSTFEKSAVARMYSCIKQDKDACRKWSQHNVPPVTRIDIQHFFKTLCL